MAQVDHPSDPKKGGVCINYKDYSPLTTAVDNSKLNECIASEINVNKARCFATDLYRFT